MRGWPLLLLVSALGMVFAELPPLPGWEVVFMEEFNGDMLNSSLWHARNNESHCCPAELQLYLARNLVVANGTLTIFTEREDVMGP